MIRILFLGSGRRVSLLRFFRAAGENLGVTVEIHAADADATSPTWEIADRAHLVPSSEEPGFVPEVVRICRDEGIDIVFPLIDAVIPPLSAARDSIAETGAKLVLSGPATVTATCDKLRTYEHFASHNIPTPRTWDATDATLPEGASFPMILKPRCGNGSEGVVQVGDAEELAFHAKRTSKPCVQQLLTGREFTFDVLVSGEGEPLCVVPRWRIATRAGEVSKGLVVLDRDLIVAAESVARSLPDARGPLNFQAFRGDDDTIYFTEINPRFGGGYVLSYHAGADFPKALLLSHLGRDVPANTLAPRDDTVLLRYDQEIITDLATLRRRGFQDRP